MNFLVIVGGAVLAAVLISVATTATAGVYPSPGQTLKGTRSIGDLIAQPDDHPVHIVFVHGMRATGFGTSNVFQDEMCKQVSGCIEQQKLPRAFLNVGNMPDAAFVGQKVWKSPAEWKASQPFVDRRTYLVNDRKKVIVDEVNWWPLLFPLKCRFLLLPEVALSGADKKDLKLCAQSTAPFYPWVTQKEIDDAIAKKSSHAGGALANSFLKQQIMNWGLSDAVIAIGPMQEYLHRTIEEAFKYASADESSGPEADYVVVSESLGSFVVMDAFASPNAPIAHRILKERTYDLYFFANQFRLLSLARLWDAPSPQSTSALHPNLLSTTLPAESGQSVSPLQNWADDEIRPDNRYTGRIGGRQRQIIAFNDPSDALTFEVPPVKGANVVNLFDRNGISWLWLLENPVTAHTGHSTNKSVLETLFKKTGAILPRNELPLPN